MELYRPALIVSAMAAIVISGCATTPGVFPKGDDLYTINVSRGDAGKVKLRAYQHAQRFCGAMGKTMQVVNENLRVDTSYANRSSSIIDLDFKCVK